MCSKGGVTDPGKRFEKREVLLNARTYVTSFLAYDTVTGLEVAWHEIDVTNLYPSTLETLCKTASVIKTLHHKNMLTLLTYWENKEKKTFYFITESLNTNSIAHQMHDGMFYARPKAIARWFKSVLKALNFLHTQSSPIVHNRIVLSTIYIKSSSRVVKIRPPLINPDCLRMDHHEIKIRTNSAPELLDNILLPASDIWAFGIAMLEVLTNKEPYSECESPIQHVFALRECRPPASLSEVHDPLAKDLLRRCFLPVSKRATAAELLRHPYFVQNFEETKRPRSQSFENPNILVIL